MRNWLLSISLMLFVAGCTTTGTTPVRTEYVYIERPKLELDLPQKPVIDDSFEYLDSEGLICMEPSSARKMLSNVIELSRYIQELQLQLDTYKKYYENPLISKTQEVSGGLVEQQVE